MAIDIGRIAYQRYIDSMKEQVHQDFDPWEKIGQIEQNAWRAAAVAVLQHYREEKIQSDEGLIG